MSIEKPYFQIDTAPKTNSIGSEEYAEICQEYAKTVGPKLRNLDRQINKSHSAAYHIVVK